MIQANELRIGNWVEFSGKYEKIAVEDINRIHYNTIQGYKPIPLTGEILLKCGIKTKTFYIKGLQLTLENNKLIGGFVDNEYGIDKGNEVELDYLHQFQNLYFELERKELEINL